MRINLSITGRTNQPDILFIQHFIIIKTVLTISAYFKIVVNFFLAMGADFHDWFS